MTLREISTRLGATLHDSDGSETISGVASLDEAGPAQISFLANQRYSAQARTTRAAAVLVHTTSPELGRPTLRLDDPYLGFARAVELFYTPPQPPRGVHPTAIVADSAVIGERASIGPYVVVGEHCQIGADAILYPHVVIYPYVVVGEHFIAHAHAVVREHCRVGDRVTVQNGAIIGADGFGFARLPPTPEGPGWYKIVQSGPAVLEDDVEVQANSCIDRASIGETRIGRGTKVDNLVQVGHGCTVGANTLLCAQVGLAGSTTLGRDVTLAGQVGVAGHCTVGDGAVATAQSGIPHDVAPGKVVSGYPAMDNRQWLRSVALFGRLPELLGKLRRTA